ncbi:MAG TPA: ABC transporter permease [Terrimesophilobacter sp.]|nr:ABC transporter permease [Terrimesophilobacter sp.]
MTDYREPSFANSVNLVAAREIRMKLRSKAFLISTGILMLAVLASVLVGGLVSTTASKTNVAATGAAVAFAEAIPTLNVTVADSVDTAKSLVREGTVEAAIIPAEGSGIGVSVIALDTVPQSLVAQLSTSPKVELLDPGAVNPVLAYFAAIAFGIVFFMSAMTFGTTIAQSVVEEKQTRIVEILMSTISVRALMAGKVIGNSILAFAQIAVIAGLAAIGLTLTGQSSLLASFGPSIAWFVVFFVFGFVMIAALYAATASLVSRQEDVGSATSPVMILVMLPYLLVIAFNNNPLVLAIMSYVPFSAPVGMPMRVFLGEAAWWEPLLSLAVLLVTTAAVTVLGSRIYSNALLRTGARVKLSEALSR